jgi:release factor glutamine methyltransferase
MDIRNNRRNGIAQLADQAAVPDTRQFVRSPTPLLDIDIILSYITGLDRARLLAHSSDNLTPEQEKRFSKAVVQRRSGLPVAYITGHKEFYGLDFIVNKDVLIPKPDTELLVEHAVATAELLISKRPIRIADVCTGSGCIGISVLHEIAAHTDTTDRLPLQLVLTDISEAALAVTEQNVYHLLTPDLTTRVSFAQGDLLGALNNKSVTVHAYYDLILSNPPYVPSAEVDKLLQDGRNEPRLALDGQSTDGLSIIRKLIPQAYARLSHGGFFLLETGEYNAAEAAQLMKQAGFCSIITYHDLAGQPRMTSGQKKDTP